MGYEHAFLFKVLLTGDSGVGKSSLLSRLKRHLPTGEPYAPTIGIESTYYLYKGENGVASMEILDTPGSYDHFHIIFPAHLQGCTGVLLVYDICSYPTFASLGKRLEKVRKGAGSSISIGLVGNKSDLNHLREVPTEDAKQFAAEHGITFIESSNLNDSLVDSVFQNFIKNMSHKFPQKLWIADETEGSAYIISTAKRIRSKSA